MKIAYVTAAFPFGHGESFLDSEIKSISNIIDDVLIVPTRPNGKVRKKWLNLDNKGISVWHEPIFSFGIFFEFLKFFFLRPIYFFSIVLKLFRHSRSKVIFFKNILVLPKGIWLAKKLKSEGVGHIHVHWGSTSSSMVLICGMISGIPWSLTCHRWDIYENNLLRIKSNYSQFIRFISKRGANDAWKIGVKEEKSVIIPMGVEVSSHPPVRSLKRKVPHILCAANLIEVKGHKYLIEAVRILREENIDVYLMLAGSGPLENDLRKFVKENELCDRIKFLGQMDHESLLNLYDFDQVDLFVLPSVETASGIHEGVPVSLMEAMARGVPCISTKTGSIEELIPADEGLTVCHSNPQELANKINYIISNRENYERASIALGHILFTRWTASRSAVDLCEKINYYRQ